MPLRDLPDPDHLPALDPAYVHQRPALVDRQDRSAQRIVIAPF